jgi:signal transduction histidine kinase
VEVHSELLINEENGQESVRVSVIDYGVGMSHKTLTNLFRIEKKMIGLGTNNETGTGLGLVLCKDFIEKHEGSIIVESKENEGSKFIITLPGRN